MILASNKVLEIIPQKAPFVMVGNLLQAEETELTSDFTISEDNVLCENGVFSTPGLMENIAQTCAAGFGYLAQKNGAEPQVGFIGSITRMKAYKNPNIGETITTNIKVVTTFESITMVKGESYLGDEKLLECEMKIVIAG